MLEPKQSQAHLPMHESATVSGDPVQPERDPITRAVAALLLALIGFYRRFISVSYTHLTLPTKLTV